MVTVTEMDGVSEAEDVVEAVTDPLGEAVADGMLLTDTVNVAEGEELLLPVALPVFVCVMDKEPVLEGVTLPLTDCEAVNDIVGVRDGVTEVVAEMVPVEVMEEVMELVRVTVGELETVVVVEGVKDGETLIEGVMLVVGLALRLAGAFPCTAFPLPSCPYVLSPQQEMAPPTVRAHT